MKAALIAVLASLVPAAAAAQPSAIDFARDVQPIFRERCYACHGSEQQMNGFRLDRRREAMRGGTQTVIGPGNADGSRLYHRLIGTNVGARMPPGTPLADDQIEIIKQWIDQGAEWPDAVSGERVEPPGDPDATRLSDAIRRGERATIDELMRSSRRAIAAHGERGTTPLMSAALYGDPALLRRLLEAGADPNAANAAGATALMWAIPDLDRMRVLLDAGADPNARSDDHRSPVVIASGVGDDGGALRLLLDYGANPFPWRPDEASPVREAVRINAAAQFALLVDYGVPHALPPIFIRSNCAACATLVGAGEPMPKQPPDPTGTTSPVYDPGRASRPTPVGPTPATPQAMRAAVERSLPLLQDLDAAFFRQTGCISCHHNSLVSMAVSAAKSHGYTVNDAITQKQLETIGRYLETWRERAMQNVAIAGGPDTVSYLLLGLAIDRFPSDAATDAQAIYLARRQTADGHWPLQTLRPPIESNDIEVTAVSLRALQAFAPAARRAEFDARIARAKTWLEHADAQATEERAFRLLGLTWAGASKPVLARAARALLQTQAADGGWAQDERMATDAYATGEALVALRESGAIAADHPAYRNGLEFLLRTQIEDGTWFVETRAVPIQAYFESGFPYGVHQWISAAATAWATTALALATPTARSGHAGNDGNAGNARRGSTVGAAGRRSRGPARRQR